ncbi:MAG TPA: hypothetical protein VNO21_23815 [Polyangiaceae bacterium]|nr:hypothetical protein [Polyangiaceae bacterium]
MRIGISGKIPRGILIVAVLAMSGCRAGGWVASVVGDVIGTKGDAFCDRRYVTDPKVEAAAFCQELVDTVAASQFEDDCRSRFTAQAADGRCPREKIVGGCKISVTNDDGSEVYDWYYDVSDLEAKSGREFQSHVSSADAVRAKCADPERYSDGAEFVMP